MFDNAEEDVSDVYTVAQGLIQRAFTQNKIRLWSGGKCYKLKAISFESDGSLDIFKGQKIKEQDYGEDET